MLRPVLSAAALAALLCAGSVSGARFVRIATYEQGTGSRTCTEDQLAQPYQDYVTGQCMMANVLGRQGLVPIQYYCDQAYSYEVEYAEEMTTCDEQRILQITRYDNRCRWLQTSKQLLTCQNLTDPIGALPFAFPPAGFAVKSSYTNVTDDSNPHSCTETAEVHAISRAGNATCQPRVTNGQKTNAYQTYTCGPDGSISVLVYSNSRCTGPIIHATMVSKPTCEITNTGSTLLTCGAIAPTPSSDAFPPVSAYAFLKTTDCNKADPSQPWAREFYTPSCFEGVKAQCPSDAKSVDFASYLDNTCSILPSDSEFPANECIAAKDSSSVMFVCSGGSNAGSINSAVIHSVSIVAALFAAVAAFVAGKEAQ